MPLFGPPDVRKLKPKDIKKLEAKRDVGTLVEALADSPAAVVRMEAACALAEVGDESALPALRRAARHPDNQEPYLFVPGAPKNQARWGVAQESRNAMKEIRTRTRSR